MLRWTVAITGLALLVTAAGASAKDKLEPRSQAMLACQVVVADDARLRCYDQAMAALKSAIAEGDLVVEKSDKPIARGGVIKASGQLGENSFWIELESGDRWKLLPTTRRSQPPQVGTRVKVGRPFYGSGYWISGPEWDESRADYMGRGS